MYDCYMMYTNASEAFDDWGTTRLSREGWTCHGLIRRGPWTTPRLPKRETLDSTWFLNRRVRVAGRVVRVPRDRQLCWLSTYYGVEAVPMYVGPAIRASHT